MCARLIEIPTSDFRCVRALNFGFHHHFFFHLLEGNFTMKRFATLLLGLGLITSSLGCYCYSPYGYGYGTPGVGGGCGPGGCPPYQPGAAYQSGAHYNSYNTIQATAPMTTAPMTAMGPTNALPTY